MPVSATLARGPRRRLRPAFRWIARPPMTILAESFETVGAGNFPWPGAPYVAMAEGGAAPPSNWEVGHGSQSLFNPGPAPDSGFFAVGGFVGPCPGAGDASFFRRTLAGLLPNRAVRASIVGARGVTISASDIGVKFGFRAGGGDWQAADVTGPRIPFSIRTQTTAGGALALDFGGVGGGSTGQSLIGFDSLRVEYVGEPDGADSLLVFPAPLDLANAFPRMRAGSRRSPGAAGYAALWRLGRDHLLTGLIRWIPRRDAYVDPVTGLTIMPWDGPGGWGEFLAYARDGQPLVFYPDATDLTAYGGGVDVAWDNPMAGPPEPEGNRHWRQEFTIRALATDAHPATSPFRGY